MTTEMLVDQIHQKKSFLCIGLDVDLSKIPEHLLKQEDPIFAFNKEIIDATHHLAVAYKPNTAFYEAHGIKGWKALEKTIQYLRDNYDNYHKYIGLGYVSHLLQNTCNLIIFSVQFSMIQTWKNSRIQIQI